MNAEVTTILGAAQENVFINGTLLTSGTTYVFKLGKQLAEKLFDSWIGFPL